MDALEPIVKPYPDGSSMELVAYRPILAQRYRAKAAERETERWMMDTVQPDWVCVDVGAHVGTYTLLLARLCEWVVAFEADRDTYEMLQANLVHNGEMGRTVLALNLAVGSRAGVCEETLWIAGKEKRAEDCAVRRVYEFTTLDWLAALDRVDLVKIDIDGWDYDALLGGVQMLARHRPLVVIEFKESSWARRGHDMDDLLSFAAEHGYTVRLLDEGARTYLMESTKGTKGHEG